MVVLISTPGVTRQRQPDCNEQSYARACCACRQLGCHITSETGLLVDRLIVGGAEGASARYERGMWRNPSHKLEAVQTRTPDRLCRQPPLTPR